MDQSAILDQMKEKKDMTAFPSQMALAKELCQRVRVCLLFLIQKFLYLHFLGKSDVGVAAKRLHGRKHGRSKILRQYVSERNLRLYFGIDLLSHPCGSPGNR